MPDDAEEWEKCTQQGVLCMEVLREKDPSKAVWQSFGLCLMRREDGHYKRIGYFEESILEKRKGDDGQQMFEGYQFVVLTIL